MMPEFLEKKTKILRPTEIHHWRHGIFEERVCDVTDDDIFLVQKRNTKKRELCDDQTDDMEKVNESSKGETIPR